MLILFDYLSDKELQMALIDIDFLFMMLFLYKRKKFTLLLIKRISFIDLITAETKRFMCENKIIPYFSLCKVKRILLSYQKIKLDKDSFFQQESFLTSLFNFFLLDTIFFHSSKKYKFEFSFKDLINFERSLDLEYIWFAFTFGE